MQVCRVATLTWLAVWQSAFVAVQSFVPSIPSNSIHSTKTSVGFASPEDYTQDVASSSTDAINGEAVPSGGGLLRQEDTKSQLFASFAALSLSDQYDAVLTGLCAKILDTSDLSERDATAALQDPLQLMEEMNQKRIPASARSLMALVDERRSPFRTVDTLK